MGLSEEESEQMRAGFRFPERVDIQDVAAFRNYQERLRPVLQDYRDKVDRLNAYYDSELDRLGDEYDAALQQLSDQHDAETSRLMRTNGG